MASATGSAPWRLFPQSRGQGVHSSNAVIFAGSLTVSSGSSMAMSALQYGWVTCSLGVGLRIQVPSVAVKNPEDITARGNMLIASSLGGMCFGNTMTGGVHATAHALGALYGIPHGLANAIMLSNRDGL